MGDFEPLESKDWTLGTSLPEGFDEATDILKVFATEKMTDYRSLQLAPLDEPPLPVARSFDENDDPLDRFLANFAGATAPADEAVQRDTLVLSAPQGPRLWATGQVELTVKKA